MSVATYKVSIDRNNDGDFIDAGEDVTSDVRAQPGITITRGRSPAQTIPRPVAGTCDFWLDNSGSTYQIGTTVSKGKPTYVEANFSATDYPLFYGEIEETKQLPNVTQQALSVKAHGVLRQLVGKKVSTALYQDIAIGTAIGHLLDAASFPAADRDLNTGESVLSWWWLDDEDAFQALMKLLDTEGPGAAIYEDESGSIVFRDRLHLFEDTASTSSQATFRGSGTEPLHSPPFDYDDGLRRVGNECRIRQKIRTAKTASAFWSLGETLTLGPSQSATYVVRTSNGDPFTGATSPLAAGTDYTVVTGAVSSATLDRTSGGTATLTVTATAAGLVATGLQVRGQVVSVDNTTDFINTEDASTSITSHGLVPISVNVIPEIGTGLAQNLCNGYVIWYQDGRPTITVTVNNGADARLTQILSREISDRITIIESTSGLNDVAWITRVSHRITGRYHEAQIEAEEVPSFSLFTLDSSQLDSSDRIWF